jgi:hypothetical protein
MKVVQGLKRGELNLEVNLVIHTNQLSSGVIDKLVKQINAIIMLI